MQTKGLRHPAGKEQSWIFQIWIGAVWIAEIEGKAVCWKRAPQKRLSRTYERQRIRVSEKLKAWNDHQVTWKQNLETQIWKPKISSLIK